MHITFITLFPEIIQQNLLSDKTIKAIQNNQISYDVINLRDYGIGKFKQVDDIAYGGGDLGMVIKPDVLSNAIDDALNTRCYQHIVYPSPQGKILDNNFIKSIRENTIIICGRFEGIDYRIIEYYHVKQVSVGDFILSGGEIPALLIMDMIGNQLNN